MQQILSFRAHPIGRGAVLLFVLCFGLLGSFAASAAHTSLKCSAKSGAVSNGGSVAINITDCATNIGFAGTGAVDGPALPAHGSAMLRISGSNWFVDYKHNGDKASNDVLEFTDGTVDGNTVRVTISISKN